MIIWSALRDLLLLANSLRQEAEQPQGNVLPDNFISCGLTIRQTYIFDFDVQLSGAS
jgi:hypothetical protein